MTEPDPNDRGAVHSALNDSDFPDDERGLTGTRDDVRGDTGSTGPEGQTARDVFPEDNGVPDVSQDDFPTMQRSEDPQFAPELGDRESHRSRATGRATRPSASARPPSSSPRAGRCPGAWRRRSPTTSRTCAPPRTRAAASGSSSRTTTPPRTPTPAPTAPPTTSRPASTRWSAARARRSERAGVWSVGPSPDTVVRCRPRPGCAHPGPDPGLRSPLVDPTAATSGPAGCAPPARPWTDSTHATTCPIGV